MKWTNVIFSWTCVDSSCNIIRSYNKCVHKCWTLLFIRNIFTIWKRLQFNIALWIRILILAYLQVQQAILIWKALYIMASPVLIAKLRPLIIICQIYGLIPFSMEMNSVTGRFQRFTLSLKHFPSWWYAFVLVVQVTCYVISMVLRGEKCESRRFGSFTHRLESNISHTTHKSCIGLRFSFLESTHKRSSAGVWSLTWSKRWKNTFRESFETRRTLFSLEPFWVF